MIRFAHIATLAALLAAAVPAGAQSLRYEPGAEVEYTRTQHDHVVQTVNGSEQTADIRSFWRFATEVEEDADGLVVRIVHDSLSLETTPTLPQAPDFAQLYGRPVVVRMSDRGEIADVTLPDSLPASLGRFDLKTSYRMFFPVLPDEPVEEHSTWADTSRVTTNQNGLDITVVRTTNYVVGETGSFAGRDGALRVTYEAAYSLDGTGSQGGAEISLSGTGTGTGTIWFEPEDGVYLGGTDESEMKMNAFVAAGSENLLIPIVQTRTETIEPVN